MSAVITLTLLHTQSYAASYRDRSRETLVSPVFLLRTFLKLLGCQRYQTASYFDSTVSIMSCETFAMELADLPSISFDFNALNKEKLTEKVQNAL